MFTNTPFISSLNCGVKYASDRIRFDVNARLRILLTPESKRSVFYVGGLRLPREVFWKRILAKLRIWRRFGCQCERVYRIMRRERRVEGMVCFCCLSLRFSKRIRQNAEFTSLVWKQTEAQRRVSEAKRNYWKRSWVRSWLRLWQYEKGIRSLDWAIFKYIVPNFT